MLSKEEREKIKNLSDGLKSEKGKRLFEEIADVKTATVFSSCDGARSTINATCQQRDFKEMTNTKLDLMLKKEANLFEQRNSTECLGNQEFSGVSNDERGF